MNKLFTLKTTLIIALTVAGQFTLKAQDTARRIIVVVRPGQTSGTWTSYEEPSSTTTIVPAATSPSKTATAAPVVVAPAPVAAPPVKKHVIVAPVTSERALTPNYSHPAPGRNALGTVGSGQDNGNIRMNSLGTVVTPPVRTYSRSTGGGTGTRTATTPGSPVVGAAAAKTTATITPANGSKDAIPGNGTSGSSPHVAVIVLTKPGENDKTDSLLNKKDSLLTKKDSLLGKKDSLLAKKDSSLKKRDTVYITKHDTVTVPPPRHQGNQIIFGEIGGAGLAISINYDQRIHKGVKDGFGFRVGAGYFADGGNIVFTIPLQVNYLLKFGDLDGEFFEFGLGTTFVNSTGDNHSSSIFEFDRVTGFIGTANIGVRYEPAKRLNFRLGYVPILYDEGIIHAGGFSVGYTF